jgi:hypothetical protein
LWEPGEISYDEDDVSEEDAEELERSFCLVKADLLPRFYSLNYENSNVFNIQLCYAYFRWKF